MDSLSFATFTTNGVTLGNTFDTWRQKTNGIIEQVFANTEAIAVKADAGALNAFVTLTGNQTISDTKTFTDGIKIGDGELTDVDSTITSTYDFSAPQLINSGSTISINGVVYDMPSTPAAVAAMLTFAKTGVDSGTFSWTALDSLADLITSSTVTTTNVVVPVGSVTIWSGSAVPTGWLECDGSQQVVSEELAGIIGTLYGDTDPSAQPWGVAVKFSLPHIHSAETAPDSEALKWIIKDTEDNVTSFILTLGNGLSGVVNATPSSTITIAGGTISVNYDSATMSFGGSGLGVKDASITPAKLSVGHPTWDASGHLTVATPTTALHSATKDYVDTTITAALAGSVGSALRFPEKFSSARSSSTPISSAFAYIGVDQHVYVSGASTGSRFGFGHAYGNEPLYLPLGKLASKLYVGVDYIIVIDTTGVAWAMGANRFNMFGVASYASVANEATWVQAFYNVPVAITKIVCSGNAGEGTLWALDAENNLWGAGRNQYGELADAGTTATSAKVVKTATITKAGVSDACCVNSVNSGNYRSTICAQLVGGTVQCAGYGAYGQCGTNNTTNTAWFTITTGPGSNLTGVTSIWGSGSDTTTSFFAKVGTDLYAWGYNADERFGITTTSVNRYAIVVNDLYPVEGKTISKLFTHVTATPSTMILTTEPKLYVTGTNSFGKFGMGVSTASYSAWTESPWSTTPGTAGLTISDVFAANGDVNSGPNFILATDGVNKSLWAAGNNVEGACGRGASASNIVTWTRLHLPSDIVNLISDVQIGSASGSNFTALLLTNGTVYFTGRNDYTPDANLPHGTDRHNFTYIRNI